MKQLSIRDIIGPIMVGPSSSHTAGALRIAQMARNLLSGEPVKATFTLYGSFARTYQGHGTDRALVAGLLGLHTDDLRIKESFALADEAGLQFSFEPDTATKVPHPNTVDLSVTDSTGAALSVRGVSVGGGAAELTRIDGIDVHITGEFNNMIVRQHDVPGVLAHISNCLGQANVNIGTAAMHRDRIGGNAFVVMDIDDEITPEVTSHILENPAVQGVRVIPADGLNRKPEGTEAPRLSPDKAREALRSVDFESGRALLDYCQERGISISEAFARREEALAALQGLPASVTDAYLERVLQVMRESCSKAIDDPHPSLGGLIGGEAAKLMAFAENKSGGDPKKSTSVLTNITALSATAMAVLETNASMGRIVAAPTAGSAGVLPAVLLTLADEGGFSDAQLHGALMNAAAIGLIITRNATVAGAEGGCQAEIGSASAMAASATVELLGGTPAQCLDAASNALANLLGLVCDPVGGLVETPCQKRNATAAANALSSASMALAGISNLIPFDETVEAMRKVGCALPHELRETALGGMAACPSCQHIGSCH